MLSYSIERFNSIDIRKAFFIYDNYFSLFQQIGTTLHIDTISNTLLLISFKSIYSILSGQEVLFFTLLSSLTIIFLVGYDFKYIS